MTKRKGILGRSLLAKGLTERRPEIKALFVSGYAENAIAHLGELGQGTCFLEKPLTPENLSEKVRAILDRPL